MILVLGSTGFLGKRVCKKLKFKKSKFSTSSLKQGCDLRVLDQVYDLFREVKPEYVINCSAHVGGIDFGYSYPAELFVNNTQMIVNILEACNKFNVKRLINPISNCAYPAEASLFKEEEFWDGPMHESVQVYGSVRKLSCIGAWAFFTQYKLDVLSLILSNMYGPQDHFEEKRSHALGALIMKMIEAKANDSPEIIVWGSGLPVREWLHVDDGAESLIRGLSIPQRIEPLNIGIGKGISISELAQLIKKEVGYKGKLVFDQSKPDGAKYKTVDGSKAAEIFGWSPEISLNKGIKETIDWYFESRKGGSNVSRSN